MGVVQGPWRSRIAGSSTLIAPIGAASDRRPAGDDPQNYDLDHASTLDTEARRRWYQHGLRALLLVLIATALAMVLARWHSLGGRSTCHTLPEVLASGNYGGFDLVQGPDRPGPYESMGPVCAGKGEPVSGSFWANGKTRRFNVPGVPGKEFCVLGLIPRDGGAPTYVVLSRQTAPAPPVGQSTK